MQMWIGDGPKMEAVRQTSVREDYAPFINLGEVETQDRKLVLHVSGPVASIHSIRLTSLAGPYE